MPFSLQVKFLRIYNSVPNPLDNGYAAYALVILSSLQIFTLNGFFLPGDSPQNQDSTLSGVSSWLNQWLHFLDFTRFCSWETLSNTNCLFQMVSFLLFLITGCLGLLLFILRNRLTISYRLAISTFKGLFTLCDMLLYLPALDFLTHSYIPNADLAHQIPFGTFQNDNDSSLSTPTPKTTMTETTSFGWFKIIYLLAFLAYFFTRKLMLSVDLSFGTVLKSKLCHNDSLFQYFRIFFIVILSIVDWRVREHGLSPLVIDIISCCFGISQVVLGLKWMTYHYYKTHLLYGLISSFYLSHSAILLVRHQLEAHLLFSMLDTMRVIKMLDIAYFSTGIFCMWSFYNIYQKIYSLKLPSNSSRSLPVIAEKYNIHRILEMKQEKRIESEILHYLQCHFAVCSDSNSCPCSKLFLEQSAGSPTLTKEFKLNLFELNHSTLVEELMVARLTYFLITPNSRFYGRLSFLARVISYLAFQLNNPVQACLTVARFSAIMKSKRKKFQVFYEYFLTEIKSIATHAMTVEEGALHNYNISDGITFDENLQKLKKKEVTIRVEYTKFFSYLHESAIVDLQKLHKIGKQLVEQIEELEDTFEKLSQLNPESAELILLIIKFRRDVRGESSSAFAGLNAKLLNIFQKKSMHKKNGPKGFSTHEDLYNEKTMFMIVDLFDNPGALLRASNNFYKNFGTNQELEGDMNINNFMLPHMRAPHQHMLLQLRSKADTFTTNHTFGDLMLGLNRERLLVPFYLYVKIEIQDSQIYAAASLQLEEQKRNYIVIDERGYLVSFTKGLEDFFEGKQYQTDEKRVNISLLIPSLIPAIFGNQEISKHSQNDDEELQSLSQKKQQTVKLEAKTKTLTTFMLMTHKVLQSKSHLTNSKEYRSMFQQIKENANDQLLSADLINLLRMMSEESVEVYKVSLKYTFRKFQRLSLQSGHWEIEISKLTPIKKPTTLKGVIPLISEQLGLHTLSPLIKPSEREMFFSNGTYPKQFFPRATGENDGSFKSLTTTNELTAIESPYLRAENYDEISILKKNLPEAKILQPIKEEEALKISDDDDDPTTERSYQHSLNHSDKRELHFPEKRMQKKRKKIFVEKQESMSSGRHSAETANSSRVIRQVIKENNSMRLIKSHYYSGLVAALIIILMVIIHFLVTDSAIQVLQQLANMNIHPTLIATYLKRSIKLSYTRKMIHKQMLPSSLESENFYWLMFYFNSSMLAIPDLYQDTSSKGILISYMEKNPIPVIVSNTNEVQNMSLISALDLALSYGYTRAIDAGRGVNFANENYFPQIFGEQNTNNIVDYLLIYATEIQTGIDSQNKITVTLNLITLCIGCVCTFLALICLGLVYTKIKNKQNNILVLFCKISKKDIQIETIRLSDEAQVKGKLKAKTKDQSRFQDTRSRDRLFSSYVLPRRHLVVRTIAFTFLFSVLVTPFLICYFELSRYSSNWRTSLAEYNMLERTRNQFSSVFADAEYVYLNSDSNEESFQKGLERYTATYNIFKPLLIDFQQSFTQLAFTTNHAVYSQNTSANLMNALSEKICSYTEQDILLNATCYEGFGGIAKDGLISALNVLVDNMEKNIAALNSSSDRATTMKSIGSSIRYAEGNKFVIALSQTLRDLCMKMNDDLLDYLDFERNSLSILVAICVIGYFLLMMIGWTVFVYKLSHDLDQTKKILDILPTRLLQGNSFVRNILVKIMKVNMTNR